jgi:hypothetical protein
MRNYKRVMEQLDESELRFIQLEHDKTLLQECHDSLMFDFEETKKQFNNKISLDYYLFTMIAILSNLFEAMRLAIGRCICYLWQGDNYHRHNRSRQAMMDS